MRDASITSLAKIRNSFLIYCQFLSNCADLEVLCSTYLPNYSSDQCKYRIASSGVEENGRMASSDIALYEVLPPLARFYNVLQPCEARRGLSSSLANLNPRAVGVSAWIAYCA